MKILILMFPMTFQSSMGPGKSKCDIPSDTTQGNSYPKSKIFTFVARFKL
jgi:hypothetical protein